MTQVRLLDHTRGHVVASLAFGLRNGVPEGVRLTGAPLLWAAGIDGAGVTIANIDSGVDAVHPNLQTCPDGRLKVLSFRDYVAGDGSLQPGSAAYDDNGHGTHTAGTQAANGSLKGAAPGAQLRAYKVLDKGGHGQTAHLTRAVNDAVADGCQVLSLSLGAPFPVPEWEDAIKRAVAAGCLVIVAAGNDGPGTLLWPAYYSDVISVGAVRIDPDTGELAMAYFSTTNPEVDLAAHGYQVLSTMPGGNYITMSGTSMAAPHVAGLAALILQLGAERLGRPMSEPAAWEGLKTRSIPLGTREQAGAGLATTYTVLPKTCRVQVTIGEKARWVDGAVEPLDVAPVIVDGRTLVPARHTHEPLGDQVSWNGQTQTVTITRRVLPGLEV